jgi:glycolate oxidase FAD binding subunit
MPRSRPAVDGAAPVAAPADERELGEIVADCDRSGTAIAIAGGNTLGGMGFPPERDAITLLTTKLKGIVANERADLVVAARAGTTATLGGTLAAGWLGPRRHRYGRLRDYVIGSTIVLADGTVARAGGMVVKNVAGYDMSRLYVGSFGTLGVLVRANFKTVPLAPQARLFLASLPEQTRSRACAQVGALRLPPSAAFWIDGFDRAVDGDVGDEGRILVLLEGSEALLERATLELRSALGRAGVPETQVVDAGAREAYERVVDAYVACMGDRSVTYRLYPTPEESERCALSLHELARQFGLRSETIVDLMNGDVVLRVRAADARKLGAAIEAFDDELHESQPRAQVVASNHPQRPYLRVWGTDPAAVEQMRALKARFDPNRTLNPGRFVGGI